MPGDTIFDPSSKLKHEPLNIWMLQLDLGLRLGGIEKIVSVLW